MLVRKYLSDTYPRTDAFCAVNSIEDELIRNNFLVVFEEDKYCGLLIPADLIKHPKRIVIDCLTEKRKINAEDTIIFALDQLNESHSCALPVFENNQFIGIVQKGTIVYALKGMLNELNEKSQISQKVKTAFINGISHEIRTPLNGILGFMNLLADMDIDHLQKDYKEFTEIISENADRFLLTMNDLIEISLIHSGENVRLRIETVDIKVLLKELQCFFETKSQYRQKNLLFEYAIDNESETIIKTDKKKLKHIFYHLIDNGSRLAESGSTVLFGIEKISAGGIHCFVKNTGQTISKEEVQSVFSLFDKDHVGQSPSVGPGIGLTVVKDYVESLSGCIELATGINSNTFYFTIPDCRRSDS